MKTDITSIYLVFQKYTKYTGNFKQVCSVEHILSRYFKYVN